MTVPERIADTLGRVRRSFGALPVWAPVSWSGTVSLSEWIPDSGPHSLAFRSQEGANLEVRTSFGEPRHDVTTLVRRETGYVGGFQLAAPDRIIDLIVDGAPEPFEVWDRDGITRASASVRRFVLTIEARNFDIENLALIEVVELEPFITGSIDLILTQRRGT